MKKTLLIMLLALAAALLLTGCAGSADTAMPSQSPGAQTTQSPILPSNVPQATDSGLLGDAVDRLDNMLNAGALSTAEDALKASKELRDAVQKLTEVDTAVAVAMGDTALVGVTFDSSYKTGVDDRLRGMILDRAQAVHPGIRSVAVTDAEKDISEISSLYQMLQSGSPYTTVKANADTLAQTIERYQK